MTHDTSRDGLLATYRVARLEAARPPLVVVGLPRSGSSFLSHVLSQIADWYVFDDLYLRDKAISIGATGPLDDAALDQLLHFLGWQIRARLKFGRYAVPDVAMDEVGPMNDALLETFAGTGARWTDLQEEWLVRLAHRRGCRNWGYKQPKAFRSLPELRRAYPGAKILWLMRDPYDVMASYKHLRADSGDGHPHQYHPVAHAIYWRMAARGYLDAKDDPGAEVEFVRFDRLVAAPQAEAERIARFLGAPPPGRIDAPARPNSSFGAGNARKGITGLEAAIVSRICFPVAERLGFSRRAAPLRPGDLPDLVSRTAKFVGFRLVRNRRRWTTKA